MNRKNASAACSKTRPFSRACQRVWMHFRRRYRAEYGTWPSIPSERDRDTLQNHVEVQCCGNVRWALRAIDRIADARLPFAEGFEALWMLDAQWTMTGERPSRVGVSAVPYLFRKGMRALIRQEKRARRAA